MSGCFTCTCLLYIYTNIYSPTEIYLQNIYLLNVCKICISINLFCLLYLSLPVFAINVEIFFYSFSVVWYYGRSRIYPYCCHNSKGSKIVICVLLHIHILIIIPHLLAFSLYSYIFIRVCTVVSTSSMSLSKKPLSQKRKCGSCTVVVITLSLISTWSIFYFLPKKQKQICKTTDMIK